MWRHKFDCFISSPLFPNVAYCSKWRWTSTLYLFLHSSSSRWLSSLGTLAVQLPPFCTTALCARFHRIACRSMNWTIPKATTMLTTQSPYHPHHTRRITLHSSWKFSLSSLATSTTELVVSENWYHYHIGGHHDCLQHCVIKIHHLQEWGEGNANRKEHSGRKR